MNQPTPERLRELFKVVDGQLVRRIGVRGGRAGSIAGGPTSNGRMKVRVDRTTQLVHRVIYAIHHGRWPNATIDHINGDPMDNRIENLRDVSQTLNNHNKYAARSDNKIGMLGVSANGNAWKAEITSGGRRVYLGTHATPEAAHAAYMRAKPNVQKGATR